MAVLTTTNGRIKRIFLSGLVLLILAAAAVGYRWWDLTQWAQHERTLAAPIEIDFARGESLGSLSRTLAEAGVIDDAANFIDYTRYLANPRALQAGHYRFEAQTSPISVINIISAGRVFHPVIVSFTIPEGFTGKQIIARLVAHGVGELAQVVAAWSDNHLLAQLKVPGNSFEGFYYPATYTFYSKVDAAAVITAAVKKFWTLLPPDYEAQVRERGLSLAEAVTFASLIEVETRRDDERAKVSEVIWRRLKNREPLGIDAALIYGIKDYQGDITWKHLKDAKNLYNTRIHKGLPPTPIASASINSLLAVLNPSSEGYYYYVRDMGSEDQHIFTRTHAEHAALVKKLVALTQKPEAAKKPNPAPKKID